MTDRPDQFPSAPSRPAPVPATQPPWHRFVALGDSFTEGIGDPLPDGGHRGWADRVAEVLASQVPDFAYANLAVRGRLLDGIAAEQTQPALDLQPDLVSVCAGGNDVIRRGDPDALAARMDDLVGELATTGATIIMFTGPDIGKTPVLNLVRGRVGIYNSNLYAIAHRHGAEVVDLWALRQLTDPAMWAEDRLHFSPLGHHTIALEVLRVLGVSHDLQPGVIPEMPTATWRAARASDLVWAREYLAPWVLRRLRRQSSGDLVVAKRPTAEPVFGEAMVPGSDAFHGEG